VSAAEPVYLFITGTPLDPPPPSNNYVLDLGTIPCHNVLRGNNLGKPDTSILDLASRLAKAATEIQKLRVSLISLQVVVAALVDPAHISEAFRYIQEQDRTAQNLSPQTELEQVQLLIDTVRKNPFLGRA
jgi:hypothetical protein